MTKITQKLKSRRGASLILAMVFMLLCLFVGGSVLAAATANGGRVADLNNSQQTYLSQRSAALLMADMLEGDGNSNLQLTIKRVSVSTESGDPTVTTTYSLSGSSAPTNLQRILVENAVEKYRKVRGNHNESFSGFTFPGFTDPTTAYLTDTNHLYPGTTDSENKFKIGKFTISEPNGSEPISAFFSSPYPEENTKLSSDVFDLTISFADNTQISLFVKATYSENKSAPITQNGITTTTTTTVIRWDDPLIEKGGLPS